MAQRDEERAQAQDEGAFKVTDRRAFAPDGQLRPDAARDDEEETAPQPAATSEPPRSGGRAAEEPRFERRSVEEPEGVDFTMLINAMAEPALLFLGEIPHPATGKPTVDLERARIQIDMLDLLRVKCRGNLTAEEEGLLDRILYQIRMLYVSRANQAEH